MAVDCPFLLLELSPLGRYGSSLPNVQPFSDPSHARGHFPPRLARRGIELFDLSRRHHGLPAMRYPSRQEMVSPTFALWSIAMVNDFAHWRRDRAWLRARLPGVRALTAEVIDREVGDKNQTEDVIP